MRVFESPFHFRRPALFWLALLAVITCAFAPGGDGALSDKALHFGGFATLALIGGLTGAMTPSWRALAFWAGLAVAIESAQGLMPFGREASALDACASFGGALLGMPLMRTQGTLTLRGPAIAGLVVVAATLLVDAGYRSARGPLTRVLLAEAFERADARPWPAAPAKAYAILSLPGAAPIIVVDNASPRALALAPGLWPDRKPGETGVTIIMGHRNAAFRALGGLAINASVRLTARDGAHFDYIVSRREVVRWNDSHLYPDMSGEQLALVTCWPVDTKVKSPWRLVVYATRTPASGLPMRSPSSES